MKSIGVMTRGKAETKYFPSRQENLHLSEIEKEKCVGERTKIEMEEPHRPAGGIRATGG